LALFLTPLQFVNFFCNLALPVLLYGSETWTIKARDVSRITAAEMKYMRRKAGYIWTDYVSILL
jgi:ABC-type ATPase involved in cell division